MADDEEEKTEEPTGKKIEKAKGEGNVPKSSEVIGATLLIFGTVYLVFFSEYTMRSIENMMRYIFGFIGEEITERTFFNITEVIVQTSLIALAPLFIMLIILTLITNISQFGFLLNPLQIKFEKLNPIGGLKSLFSLKKLLEASKLLAKLSIIVVVMGILFMLTGEAFLAMMDKEIMAAIDDMILLTIYFLAAILFIILLFAIIDFFFTRYYYMKSLRMTKQEVKDEWKNMEGDPRVKARIRSIQMKMAMQRMMQSVPDADVVITNPTHYAVAMKYDNEVDSAPKVVAKGVDFIALQIRDIAKENNIPIIENPALARALNEQVEIDQIIPEGFYKAIAEIFSYIYTLKSKR